MFEPGDTPFGIFDNDPEFASDADKIVQYVWSKLGSPVMLVHLSSSQIYTSFEEACLEYSAIVNMYQAKSVLATFLGAPTGSLSGSQNTYPARLLALEEKMAEPYANDAGLNSTTPTFSGTIMMLPGQQKYDLKALLTSAFDPNTNLGVSGYVMPPNTRVKLTQVYYFSPLQAYRFFGTTSAINYLNNQFNFESFTPETIFYLLPIWEDILRGMQFKTSQNVRRSNYSYEVLNNELTIYPCPAQQCPLQLSWQYEYQDPTQPTGPDDQQFDGVANLSNIPFGNITYSNLNSISKQWIRRFTFSLAEQLEGQIRGKMVSIPIPNGDLTLNGPELVANGIALQTELREELKAFLDETTYDKIMQREAEMQQALEQSWKGVPLGLYIG